MNTLDIKHQYEMATQFRFIQIHSDMRFMRIGFPKPQIVCAYAEYAPFLFLNVQLFGLCITEYKMYYVYD